MITIFTIPKAFNGRLDIVQRNAIASWVHLGHGSEIVLCGDDPGTKEAAKRFDLEYIPDIDRNVFGTPLLSSAFSKVRQVAKNDLLCYVNADIIFLRDFIISIGRVKMKECLIIGNRWNLEINDLIDFTATDNELKLRKQIEEAGSLQSPIGSDYFVFRKDESLGDIPPFAVGRPLWDNWFIYNARKNRYKVIDASRAITAIHQNHDYAHLKRDFCRHEGQSVWESPEGPEVDKQREIMMGQDYFFKLLDATHLLTEKRLIPAIYYQHLRRRFDVLPILYPRTRGVIEFFDKGIIALLRRVKRRKVSGK